MKTKKAGVFTPSGRKVWEHERRGAEILARAGHYVEFIEEGSLPTADILLDGVEYEIKSPEHFNVNTLEHILKNALKQSPNLIIDLSRLKKVREQKVRQFLIGQMRKSKQFKQMLLITKRGQIIDIASMV